ncbi:MAG: hypothetical protein ABIQ53_10035 [Terracoccus sp.]
MSHGQVSIDRPSDSCSGWAALFATAIAAVLVAQLLPTGVARAVVALPPILMLPGFAVLTLALGTSRPRDPALVGVLSVALSFAVMMLDALALNALGVRLSTASLGLSALLSTAALIAGACATAKMETSKYEADATASGANRLRTTGLRVTGLRVTGLRVNGLRATRGAALVASLIAGLAVVSLMASHQGAPVAAPFTTLSLGASWAGQSSAPVVHTGERVTIPIVAANRSTIAGPYQLTTSVDGAVTSVASLSLSSAATWRGQVSLVAPTGSGLHRVVISLTSGAPGPDGDLLIVYIDNVGS